MTESAHGSTLEPKFRTLAEMFLHRIADTPEREAFRFPEGDGWQSITWKQTGERVRALANGLVALGLTNEMRCGILSGTRIEWVLADLAIALAGGATTTVYPSTPAEDCAYILQDSETEFVFAEDDEQVAKLRAQRANIPTLKKVIVFEGATDGDFVISMSKLEEVGTKYAKDYPEALDAIIETIEPGHLSTLIYTSGTTGRPKGVQLVHECWTYEAEAVHAIGVIEPDDRQYLWLPLSHSFGKVLLVTQVRIGFTSAVDGRLPKLVENLSVIKPTFMAAAPRVFEKIHNKVIENAKAGGALKHVVFRRAVRVGREVSAMRQRGQEPAGLMSTRYKLADRLVFSKLRQRLGGNIKFLISGSAPLSQPIAEFFHAAGILILEGYGLTESSAASCVNRLDAFRFGTVGLPVPGTRIKLSPEDGEILIKSKGVMRGYHNLPEVTAEVLTEDGWLRTGDIGEIDPDGFLRITDRKKDLIKTSGGKYIAPQHLEGRFKALCSLASQIVVHGDRRNFCTALITLDEEALTSWAAANGLGGTSYEELTRHDKVRAAIQGHVDQLNEGLASYETIKQFAILPRDLSEQEGELTPSLKVKRKFVEKKYSDVLDKMYEGAMASL